MKLTDEIKNKKGKNEGEKELLINKMVEREEGMKWGKEISKENQQIIFLKKGIDIKTLLKSNKQCSIKLKLIN